jgi:hypothetical protein
MSSLIQQFGEFYCKKRLFIFRHSTSSDAENGLSVWKVATDRGYSSSGNDGQVADTF